MKASANSNNEARTVPSAGTRVEEKMRFQPPPDEEERLDRVGYDFGLKRRTFVQMLGTGLLVAVGASPALAQRRVQRHGSAAEEPAAELGGNIEALKPWG